jgi:uncharacterized protein (DUF2267 family)
VHDARSAVIGDARARLTLAPLLHSRADKEKAMARLHVFDSHVETANRWIEALVDSLELAPTDHGRALHALRAGLHAIRDRLPDSEVVDLAAQLPTLIRGIYYEGWTPGRETKQLRSRAAMVARVGRELAPDKHLDPVDVLRAVIHLLVEQVSDGEIQDILSTLPRPIAALWHDLTGHALVTPEVPAPHEMRRTGYSR